MCQVLSKFASTLSQELRKLVPPATDVRSNNWYPAQEAVWASATHRQLGAHSPRPGRQHRHRIQDLLGGEALPQVLGSKP